MTTEDIYLSDKYLACICLPHQVLAVSPPVVALGLSIPAVKLFTLTRPIYPTWLLEILGDDSLQNVEVCVVNEMTFSLLKHLQFMAFNSQHFLTFKIYRLKCVLSHSRRLVLFL